MNNALEEEQETRVSLEEKLETIEESVNELNLISLRNMTVLLLKTISLRKKRLSLVLFMPN